MSVRIRQQLSVGLGLKAGALLGILGDDLLLLRRRCGILT